MTMKSLIKK